MQHSLDAGLQPNRLLAMGSKPSSQRLFVNHVLPRRTVVHALMDVSGTFTVVPFSLIVCGSQPTAHAEWQKLSAAALTANTRTHTEAVRCEHQGCTQRQRGL
jgi:hypothetical protein